MAGQHTVIINQNHSTGASNYNYNYNYYDYDYYYYYLSKSEFEFAFEMPSLIPDAKTSCSWALVAHILVPHLGDLA